MSNSTSLIILIVFEFFISLYCTISGDMERYLHEDIKLSLFVCAYFIVDTLNKKE